ncbi:ABC transporter permease [Microbacterium sp.]|uniref:ABC transporter permease n=1 Tax=Microbacterium sp. TaxID=51671 RepID=UPI0039E40A3E
MKSVAIYLYAALFIAFLLFPLVVVIPASFSESRILSFPPKGFTFDWYAQLFANSGWSEAFALSLRVATVASLVTVVCAALLGLLQYRFAAVGSLLWFTSMLPLFVPSIIVATGLFTILLKLDMLGDPNILALADAAAALPVAVALMVNAFGRLGPNLWFAASSLGAKPARIVSKVLLPEMIIPILSAVVLAFASAFDEVTFAVFVGVGGSQVLPARMYSYLLYQSDPILPAVGSLLFTVALVCALLVPLLGLAQRAALRAQRAHTAALLADIDSVRKAR